MTVNFGVNEEFISEKALLSLTGKPGGMVAKVFGIRATIRIYSTMFEI
jgi:hypothetical protein